MSSGYDFEDQAASHNLHNPAGSITSNNAKGLHTQNAIEKTGFSPSVMLSADSRGVDRGMGNVGLVYEGEQWHVPTDRDYRREMDELQPYKPISAA